MANNPSLQRRAGPEGRRNESDRAKRRSTACFQGTGALAHGYGVGLAYGDTCVWLLEGMEARLRLGCSARVGTARVSDVLMFWAYRAL
ncbi:Carbamoyl-phosphate synthase small chain [Gossypium arboreum]|uniref:Carbamoyl-phosphate synthase small chain n=2 Tax=Gossypium arboreum TaxID=29729 RepID=A0A0B0NKG0_GOSAR|nr:Carbamoyl-phosphate synthase small chain [Gossypium arboreum]